jgi:hypothetical protein
MKTWMLEMALAALVLIAVVLDTHGGLPELVGALAVLLSFGHAQVADRLAEKEAQRVKENDEETYENLVRLSASWVECYRWATRYLISKEIVWVVYFVMHKSWSALAGCGLFLVYPIWRRWWRLHRKRA